MILLDMRTIVFSGVLTDIACMLVILSLWHQSHKRFPGAGFWVFDFAFQTTAVFLIILRGTIPDWMSMVLSNTLVIAGAILGYMGLGYFVGKKISQLHNYALLAAFACVHAYFTLVQPNLAARNLNVSVGLLIICFECMWLLMYRVERSIRRLTLGVGMVFGGYCLVSIVRIVGFVTGSPATNDYFHSGTFESLIIIFYQILFILLTYSLVLMVNNRLLMEVKTQEEKFAKAFRSSPYAITLTRLSDGHIVEVNDGFVNITGYPYAEVMGKTSIDLHLWDKEEDRRAAFNELSKSAKVQSREFRFRKKFGERITGLFSAEIIPINNQKFVLSSISDITERKQAEEELRQRTLELQHLTETLEQQVQERTEELEVTNEQLRNEIDECQRVEIDLKKSESDLRRLSLELLKAQEKERKLVAGEIHDGIGSSLSAVKFKVVTALTEAADRSPETTAALRGMIPIIQAAIDEARRIQTNLRPSMLDDLGILVTLRWFCRQFESTYSKIRVRQSISIEEQEVPDLLKTVIFRILQEGLNNIAKHSGASIVFVSLRKTDRAINLVIRDNGQGFDLSKVLSPNGTAQGLGLENMRERIELSGGLFEMQSTQGKGTVIRAWWPIGS